MVNGNRLRTILLVAISFFLGYFLRATVAVQSPKPPTDSDTAMVQEAELASESSILTFDPTKRIKVKVWQVVDGDTIALSKYDRVRLLGVRLSLSSTGAGLKSYQFLKNMIEGEEVELEFRPEIAIRDSQSHLLAIVWFNGVNVNAKIVEEGLAEKY